jgi:integrase
MTHQHSRGPIFFAQDELKRLFQAIDNPRDRAIWLIAYRHGLRASEVGLLRREDVDLNNYRIRISRLKGSLGGVHPLQSDEVKALQAYLRRRKDDNPSLFLSKKRSPIHRKTLDWLMRKHGKTARLPKEKHHFHCLKHSIATHLLDANGDVIFVKDWLGHKNIQNTLVYAQLTSTARDERVRRLFASQKIVGL